MVLMAWACDVSDAHVTSGGAQAQLEGARWQTAWRSRRGRQRGALDFQAGVPPRAGDGQEAPRATALGEFLLRLCRPSAAPRCKGCSKDLWAG